MLASTAIGCGGLLGLDEDPAPEPPTTADAGDDGGIDGAGDATADARGSSDAPSMTVEGGACKLLAASCTSAADCCSGACMGVCCVAGGQPAGGSVECCTSGQPLVACEAGRCCPEVS